MFAVVNCLGPTNIWRRSGFKKLDSKTIGFLIQSFFEMSEDNSFPNFGDNTHGSFWKALT